MIYEVPYDQIHFQKGEQEIQFTCRGMSIAILNNKACKVLMITVKSIPHFYPI